MARQKSSKSVAGGRFRTIRKWTIRLVLALVLLPPVLTVIYSVVPPVSTLMIGRYVQFLWVDRQWVPLEEISPNLVRSVIASEDSGFCDHDGVQWGALQKQVEALSEGERPRGASTITMQTAKNLFLWGDRSYLRKGLELPLALMLDAILTKRRIMEIYLNIAQFGPDLFGAEAAAQHYFGRPAGSLTASQAALLAATLPSPDTRDPANPDRYLRDRARTIEREARIAGAYIDCLYP